MSKIRTLHIEEIFDTLLSRLPPGTYRPHRPVQIYNLADVVPFLSGLPAIYRAGFNKLIYLEHGFIEQKIDGAVNTLEDGSLLFVKKGQVFSLESFERVTTGFILFFSPEALGEALRLRYLAQAVEANTLLKLDPEEATWFKNACSLLIAQFQHGVGSSFPIMEHLLASIVLKLIELSATSSKKWSRKEELAYEFRKTILENSHSPFEVRAIADELNVSGSYLYRCVKEITGRSPKRWLLDAALIRSRALLQQGRLSITQVSREAGFDDPSYFGRLFKRQFGVTPRDFQREVRLKKL